MNNEFQKSIRNRNYIIFGLVVLVIIGFGLNFTSFNEPVDQNQRLLKTQYLLQNTDGKILDTWNEWKPRESISINIVNVARVSQDRIDIIKDAIMSTETIEIDSKKFWKGWKGAVDFARNQIEFPPTNWMFTDDYNADIIISLQSKKNAYGFSGMTNTIMDESDNSLSAVNITIFDIHNMSDEELGTIMRHEAGHVAGLSHSNDLTDLMYPVLTDSNPYVSKCDVDALISLYNTNDVREFICE